MDGEDDGNLGIRLYAAEFHHTFQGNQNRIAELHIDSVGNVTTDPAVELVTKVIGETPYFFEYFDYEPSFSGKEPYFLPETGIVFRDTAESKVREFCNVGLHPGDPNQALGGHLFEYDRNSNTYTVMQGFFLPYDSDSGYFRRTTGGNLDDWWYPRIGDDRFSGQIANTLQGVSFLSNYHGTSMIKEVELIDPDTQTLEEYIVTGTMGGYVLAIPTPSTSDVQNGNVELHYSSPDLGWYAVGLDAADLDSWNDPTDFEHEIVVGTMVDDGNFDDWVAWDTGGAQDHKNRGGLYILDVNPTTQTWDPPIQIKGDDLDNAPRSGLGCGILGVKIDDVNNDGVPEIWASDAIGHLYLFQQDSNGDWETLYRSQDLSPYAGLYQNIYPVKDPEDNNKTKRLFVVSGGYIMGFKVDPSVVDSPGS